MKIAVAQLKCAAGNVEANMARAAACCAQAKQAGAELVVFPELTDTGYDLAAVGRAASGWDVGAAPLLREAAKRESIAIACGLSEREKGDVFNAAALIDAEGQLAAKYRKAHLFFGPGIDERSFFRPGAELTSGVIGGVRFGLSICYDLRFPELYRELAITQQVQVLLVMAAWPFPRVGHFSCLLRARAIENQCYVIAANRVGTDDRSTLCGSSAIIDPYGALVATAAEDREELIVGDISLEVLQSVRQRMPVFSHRRTDLY